MIIKLSVVFILITFLGLQALSQNLIFIPKYKTILHLDNPKDFEQCSRDVPKDIKKFTKIEDDELRNLFANMGQIYSLTESTKGKPFYKIDSLDRYGFQFFGLNIKGKNYIYCNAVRIEGRTDIFENANYWNTRIISICDGGYDFWGVLYDIKKHKFLNLVFNGGG